MANTILSSSLSNRRVLTADGRQLGEVSDVELDAVRWRVTRLAVRLRRDVLDELGLSRPLVGTRTVWMPISLVAAVGDAVVLHVPLSEVTFAAADHAPSQLENPGESGANPH